MTELVEHVDDQDRVLGVVARDEAIRRGWLHRVATTVCRDAQGRFLVSRRADGLSRFPRYYEISFGGAVGVGEPYDAAAVRELAEELGVHVPVREVVKFLCRGEVGTYWLAVHEAVVAGELVPDPGAVSWLGWMTKAELDRAVRQHRFIPDGQEALRRYLAARDRPVTTCAPQRPGEDVPRSTPASTAAAETGRAPGATSGGPRVSNRGEDRASG